MSNAIVDTDHDPVSAEPVHPRPLRPFGLSIDTPEAVEPSSSYLYGSIGKRLLDTAVASIALLLAAPLMTLVWLTLRVTLGRRVILRQKRVGRYGQTFGLLKFRTMEGCRRMTEESCSYIGTDRRHGHKSCEDPRHTRIGRVIRKFSLDELPQLLNVLRGDMSLVGPRPELTSVATEEFLSHIRHSVRPGLTGPFQVSEFRGRGNLQQGLPLDEGYVADLKLFSDLRYLALTVGVLRQGTGS